MNKASRSRSKEQSKVADDIAAPNKGNVIPAYAELHAISNFTFLRGASHPEELVTRAQQLAYSALALTDECSLAGIVRAHIAARNHNLALIVGSEFRLEDGTRLVLYASDRERYGDLSQLITRGRRAAAKGSYRLTRDDVAELAANCPALWLPGVEADFEAARWLAKIFPGRAWIAVELLCRADDEQRLQTLIDIGRATGLPLMAAGDVHMHVRARRALQDTLTAIRLRTTVQAAGHELASNGERHLRPRETLARVYPPELLRETLRLAACCRFSLDELRYEYPRELVPEGETTSDYLRRLTEEGMRRRWPRGVPDRVRAMVEHELDLIAELEYEPYFLTVHDIVAFARSRNILCQGRGSAANSAVCYCLGITEVDPARMEMLFERFVSRERNEPPDIDVDFEHERREEVIQYLYNKYGRHRAALAATVISYRPRSAVRDVGKALGLDLAQVDRLAKNLQWWDGDRGPSSHGDGIDRARLHEVGFDADNPVIHRLITLVRELLGFPRHLSQHVGGFVIARDELSRLVPIENAAMEDRSIIQWDKDDLDALGLLKVDCLALGMLTAIHRALDLLTVFRGRPYTLAEIPPEDPRVYQMIQRADTVGVFQIESRAQMAMLPRLRPACFYDLVIEVAIVRPGPIQGDMVHPYLRRRQGREAVSYPSPAVRGVLERTLGVPIFQEQVIKLAMVAAGFTPGEADALRRSMAAWRRRGGLESFERRLIEGMGARGYAEQFARQIFAQIQGFGEYGFPESHAASFALLVYVSAWLKCHEPAAFTCALLNSQPMGFYAPAQLVQDARRHGVKVRPVDANHSEWDCTLEVDEAGEAVIRLGLCLVRGLSRDGAGRLVQARAEQRLANLNDLARRARLNRHDLDALAAADAFKGLAGHRHRAHWAVLGIEPETPLLSGADIAEGLPLLRTPTEGEEIIADYSSLSLTLGRHPLALIRKDLQVRRAITAQEVARIAHGEIITTAGLVICRQRPASAAGVIFVTLEDETGTINLVVWQRVMQRYRRALLGAQLLGVIGEIQREGEVLHVVARQLIDYSDLLDTLSVPSRDFR
jgi:error-prone DNA polymerase